MTTNVRWNHFTLVYIFTINTHLEVSNSQFFMTKKCNSVACSSACGLELRTATRTYVHPERWRSITLTVSSFLTLHYLLRELETLRKLLANPSF